MCDCISENEEVTESRGSTREIIFAVLRPWVNLAPPGNQNQKTTCSMLGPPYSHLLQSAGATEGLFFLRGRSPSPEPNRV